MKMKKYVSLSLSLMLLMVTAFAAGPASAKSPVILEFSTMVGVPRPYTGATNAIRGVPGGGLPWVISFGQGELKADGKLEVKVMGLVLDPNDPATGTRGGTNPSPTFKVIVSCLSRDTSVTPAAPTTVNVSTDPFPADAAGNAQVEAQLSLPSPCIAPIIFVTNANGSWFAATGF